MQTRAEQMVQGYITCALWSSTEGEIPLDEGYDLSPLGYAQAVNRCQTVLLAIEDLLDAEDTIEGNDLERIGHDLWLTRNHHGAGFWDGDYPTHGRILTRIGWALGTADIHVNDQGQVEGLD